MEKKLNQKKDSQLKKQKNEVLLSFVCVHSQKMETLALAIYLFVGDDDGFRYFREAATKYER